jgi:hypothetical protein
MLLDTKEGPEQIYSVNEEDVVCSLFCKNKRFLFIFKLKIRISLYCLQVKEQILLLLLLQLLIILLILKIRSKILFDNMILEQVNTFTYLGSNISYQGEKNVFQNHKILERHTFQITKLLQISGHINNTLKTNLIQRSRRSKLYKTLALPTHLYGSEIWTLKECDEHWLRTAEFKQLQRTAGCTLIDHKRNKEILEELHVTYL